MAELHHLENKMRMIKLGGMVETLNMRLDQAQKEGLAFSQFLEMLLEDEVQHRANKRLATRLSRARFEEEKNLEGFDFNSIRNYRRPISESWLPASLLNARSQLFYVVR